MFPPRRSESQASSCLPTPPPTSNVKESPLVSAKRRKVGIDDGIMDVKVYFILPVQIVICLITSEMDNGSDLKSNRPSDTTPCANDTEGMLINVRPHILPVTSLSSDSDRTEVPLNRQVFPSPQLS